MPETHSGNVMGHETMGEVVEVGKENTKLKVGDRVVPFTISSISCGKCFFCSAVYIPAANAPTQIGRKSPKYGAIRRPAFSDIHIFLAAMQVDRPNICACLIPMSDRLRCRTDLLTSTCFFRYFPNGLDGGRLLQHSARRSVRDKQDGCIKVVLKP
ncbi:hypothetical protein FHX14_006625 [Rhizobium sp. BK619]|nr:hypothetical protein [Rhizobium sp. BK619]